MGTWKRANEHPLADEKGLFLIDVIVAILLSAIIAMGLTQSALVSYRYSQKAIADSVATQLALEKLEEYGTINPETLSDGDQQIETEIIREGISFRRQLDVSINALRSRVITVQVTSNKAKLSTDITLSNAFALWGER